MSIARNIELALWLYNTGCPCAAEDCLKAALLSLKSELDSSEITRLHRAAVSDLEKDGYEEIPIGR